VPLGTVLRLEGGFCQTSGGLGLSFGALHLRDRDISPNVPLAQAFLSLSGVNPGNYSPEHTSPDDSITLFTMYYTPEIMDIIVEKTNEYAREPVDDSQPYARANHWYPT
jgi:hypothetical protein